MLVKPKAEKPVRLLKVTVLSDCTCVPLRETLSCRVLCVSPVCGVSCLGPPEPQTGSAGIGRQLLWKRWAAVSLDLVEARVSICRQSLCVPPFIIYLRRTGNT